MLETFLSFVPAGGGCAPLAPSRRPCAVRLHPRERPTPV
ncbi:putative protein associated with topo II-related 1, partial [Danaus plexippus plexippus]